LLLRLRGAEVDGPIRAFAWFVDGPRYPDETLVQRQVVPDGVLPTIPSGAVVRVMFHDPVVDFV